MYAAALRAELRIPNVHSLKEKRSKVRALKTMLSTKFPVAVAEVGFQDQWQRSTFGIAAVAPQAGQLERLLHSVQRALERHPDIEVLECVTRYLEES